MNSNVDIEYANAYTEVLEVMNHMSEEDYYKIPKDMIDMFRANCNNEYQFRYDLKKKFEEQEISKRGKLILAILFRDYWATLYQKERIIAKQDSDRQELERQKLQKYSRDNLFEKNLIIKEEKRAEFNIDSLIVNKESNIFKKIINKIRDVFKKRYDIIEIIKIIKNANFKLQWKIKL